MSDELPDFHPMTVIREWKSPAGPGDDFRFHLADAQTGVICFGATGSGKTSGPAKFLAMGYLANDFGGLVLCAKKEELAQWRKWAAATGRSDDLVIIDRQGAHRFNFLDWEASRAGEGGGVTINIVALLDEIAGAIAGSGGQDEGGGDNKFFDDALHHMNTNLVDLVQFTGAAVTLPLMRSVVNSAALSLDDLKTEAYQDGNCATALRGADAMTKDAGADVRADFEECRTYWEKEWPTLSDKTRSIIQLSFSMLVRPLLTRPLRRLFCEDTNVKPEHMFAGKIIIVDLPVQEFRLAGRVANLVWKYCTQIAVLRRSQPNDGTFLRPVFIWADEYQNFASPFDSEWAAVARSAAGCTTFLVQNRESLLRVLGDAATVDSLLGNLQAKFFCQNTGDTNEWASKHVLGEYWADITNSNIGQSDAATSGTFTSGLSSSQQQRRYVDPARFSVLRRGGPKNKNHVDCVVYNGGQLFKIVIDGEPMMVPYKLLVFEQKG